MLTNEQAAVLAAILDSAVRCVYVDGSAGTGKSFLIREAVRRLNRVHVVAPTGLASESISGYTIHNFFGIREFYTDSCSSRCETLENAEYIIVDEISMVSAELLDLMDRIARRVRRRINSDLNELPFGGIKMIFIGDLYQLLPVNKCEDEKCPNKRHDRGLIFQSDVWLKLEKSSTMQKFFLRDSQRHKGDHAFLAWLQKIRNASMTSDDFVAFKALLQRRGMLSTPDAPSDSKVVYLYPCGREVAAKNALEQNKLPGIEQRYCRSGYEWHIRGLDENTPSRFGPLTADGQVECLCLKVGSEVMLTKNIRVSEPFLVNGSRGIVTKFVSTEEALMWTKTKIQEEEFLLTQSSKFRDLLRFQQELCNSLLDEKTVITKGCPIPLWPVVLFRNKVEMPILLLQVNRKDGIYEANMPLQLAWAITIHKSQGLTLDKVHVDFARSFSDGMIYTALSRVRGIDGLRVENLKHDVLRCNAEVTAFYDNKHTSTPWYDANAVLRRKEIWDNLGKLCEAQCPGCEKFSLACELWANADAGLSQIFKSLENQIPPPRRMQIREALEKRGIDVSILCGLIKENTFNPAKLRELVDGEILLGDAIKVTDVVKKLFPKIISPLKSTEVETKDATDEVRASKRQRVSDIGTDLFDSVLTDRSYEHESIEHVYVLRLAQGKYYVGKTNNITRRLEEHRNQAVGCSEWTKKYRMLDTVEPETKLRPYDSMSATSGSAGNPFNTRVGDANALERLETLYQFRLHGIDNVRGSIWATMELNMDQRRDINRALAELDDRCFRCGQTGHVERECPLAQAPK